MGVMIFAVFLVITLGTFFQFGYHNGVINQPLELITQFIENVTIERHGEINGTPLTLLTSLCVSTYLIGGLFGSLLGGILSNKLGRRTSIIILSVPCVVGSVLLMLCKWAHSFEMIIIGRLIVGLACGAFTAVGPAYLYEVSPHTVRGAAGSLNQLVCVFSLLLSQLLGLKQAMKTEQLWPLLLGLNAVPCVLTAVCLLFIPESPRFLYIVRNDVESAKAAFFKIGRSPEQVEFELDEMLRELETSQHKISLITFFRTPHLRWGLLVALVCQVGQQFSGLNGLLYYSGTLFTQNGLTTEQATYATIGLGLALFFSSLVSTLVMDRLGRRVLMIGGLLISFFSLIVFTVCLIIHDSIGAQWPVYIAVAATYVFVIGFGIGPGPVPWLITAEMFTQESRDAAVSMSVAVNWLCNIAIGLLFLQLLTSIGIYSFVPFIIIILGVALFLYFCLPETKGRSVTEVRMQLMHYVQHRSYASYEEISGSYSTAVMENDESENCSESAPIVPVNL